MDAARRSGDIPEHWPRREPLVAVCGQGRPQIGWGEREEVAAQYPDAAGVVAPPAWRRGCCARRRDSARGGSGTAVGSHHHPERDGNHDDHHHDVHDHYHDVHDDDSDDDFNPNINRSHHDDPCDHGHGDDHRVATDCEAEDEASAEVAHTAQALDRLIPFAQARDP